MCSGNYLYTHIRIYRYIYLNTYHVGYNIPTRTNNTQRNDTRTAHQRRRHTAHKRILLQRQQGIMPDLQKQLAGLGISEAAALQRPLELIGRWRSVGCGAIATAIGVLSSVLAQATGNAARLFGIGLFDHAERLMAK